ncbi:MAG: CocE/NonD family hydrolase [Bacteroidota bacterium]
MHLRLIALFFLLTVPVFAQPPRPSPPTFDVKAHYTKLEFMVPMRDGVKLFTSVYVPTATGKYPIMLNRTPYSVGPYGPNEYKKTIGPGVLLMKDLYIFVYQDVRGRWYSEGTFEDMRPHNPNKKSKTDTDESTDTYDTAEWLLKNISGNNGKIGVWGISYGGFYSSMALINAHPAIKAVSPQAPIADWFVDDDMHHNGAFLLQPSFNFFSSFGRRRKGPGPQPWTEYPYGTPDGYKFFLNSGSAAYMDSVLLGDSIRVWHDLVSHPTYDAFWKARNILPHLQHVKPAVLTVGGLFDAEDMYGPYKTYEAIEKNNPGIDNFLVMGPWFHGGWDRSTGEFLGNVHFGSNTSEFYQQNIELPFFQYYLKGAGQKPNTEAWVFETGKNSWQQHKQWPVPAKPARLFLQPGGKLAATSDFSLVNNSPVISFDDYISDPGKPVPSTADIGLRMTREFMTEDQRFAANRTDVLVYQTPLLTEDFEISGPLFANLNISTNATDADFVVKLIDVMPDTMADSPLNPSNIRMGGYQFPVRMEVMRAKFRNSLEIPEAIEPEKLTLVRIPMQDVSHTFRKGHRIMVQVQSSWFPLIDRNPQVFTDIYQAKPGDYKKALIKVYTGSAVASYLEVSQPDPAAIPLPMQLPQTVKKDSSVNKGAKKDSTKKK